MKYPALPKSLMAPGGPVSIVLRQTLTVEGKEAWGAWERHTRTIEIVKTAPPEHQWRVLFHELTHAALDDAGAANLMTAELEETICDAISTARFRERFG